MTHELQRILPDLFFLRIDVRVCTFTWIRHPSHPVRSHIHSVGGGDAKWERPRAPTLPIGFGTVDVGPRSEDQRGNSVLYGEQTAPVRRCQWGQRTYESWEPRGRKGVEHGVHESAYASWCASNCATREVGDACFQRGEADVATSSRPSSRTPQTAPVDRPINRRRALLKIYNVVLRCPAMDALEDTERVCAWSACQGISR